MGYLDGFDFDDNKSLYLKETRGFSFEEIVKLIFRSESPYALHSNPTYPDQFRVIAKIKRTLLTIVCEDVEDEFGAYTRLITYWESTPKEKSLFNEVSYGK